MRLTQNDVINRLRWFIEDNSETQAHFAKANGISPQYVNDVLKGHRAPGQAILDSLGLEKKIYYTKKKKGNENDNQIHQHPLRRRTTTPSPS